MVRTLPLSQGRRRSPGVTLLEILVAVAVLAVGLSTIFQIFPMGFAASAKSSAQTTAFELAARKLEDVRNNHLFGGVPTDGSGPPAPADNWKYWGKLDAPNPDGTTYQAVNTNGQFAPFSATLVPERSYFYRVQCMPVLDPARKYLELPTYNNYDTNPAWRGFATCYRVTVTVRGPLKTQAEAQDDQWTNNTVLQKGAVQVQLVTYIANKALGDALLAVDTDDPNENPSTEDINDPGQSLSAYGPANAGNCKPIRYGDFPTAWPKDGADYIYIKGIDSADGGYPYPENFTVFNARALSLYETDDAGPTVVLGASNDWPGDRGNTSVMAYGNYPDAARHGLGLNETGLDNVLVFCYRSHGSKEGYIAESNKVIGLDPPGISPNASAKYWRLRLLRPLVCRDGDYAGRYSPLMDGTYTDDTLLDKNLGGGGVGKYGYPEGTYSSGTYGGTRVRFLMRMERRS